MVATLSFDYRIYHLHHALEEGIELKVLRAPRSGSGSAGRSSLPCAVRGRVSRMVKVSGTIFAYFALGKPTSCVTEQANRRIVNSLATSKIRVTSPLKERRPRSQALRRSSLSKRVARLKMIKMRIPRQNCQQMI